MKMLFQDIMFRKGMFVIFLNNFTLQLENLTTNIN